MKTVSIREANRDFSKIIQDLEHTGESLPAFLTMAGVFAAASARQVRNAAPGDAATSGKRLDAPCRAEAAARRVAIRRPPGASKRSTDVPASLVALHLPGRTAGSQRKPQPG